MRPEKVVITVPDTLVNIAARIRELRDILELSAEDVAKSVGLSVDTLLAYESAQADIPISALYALASRYGVDFTVLITGQMPRMDTHCLVRAGEGVCVERYAGYRYQSLAFNFMHRTMEPMIVSLAPQDEPPAPVTHGGQEFNYVLEGQVEVTVGPRAMLLQAGDSLYFNPALPHGQRAIGGPARFLTVIQE